MGCNVEFYNIKADVLAAAFIAPPKMGFVGNELKFPHAYNLVALTLSTTMVNFSTTNEMGVFVVIGSDQPELTFSDSTGSPMGHVTLNNSLTGPPVVFIPTNKTTPLPFPVPKLITPAMRIRLYAFGDTTANNRLLAYLSAQVVLAH